MNAERIAIAGWGVLETGPEGGPRGGRPWKARRVGLGSLLADAVGVAVEAVLVLLPRVGPLRHGLVSL